MKLNNYLKDGIAIISFFLITLLFWGPLFTDKVLVQSDIQQYNGMATEIKEYKKNGERIHWTNSGYGGMPTYLLGESLYDDSNLTGTINHWVRKSLNGVSAIFLIGLICFYILMRAIKVNHWLAILGSFLFMAGSFSIQSFVAGHNSKMNAFAYAPLILAGLIYLFKRRPWLGVFCLAFGLAAQITVNHLQITYYTFLICAIYFVAEIIINLKNKTPNLWKPIVLSITGVVIALGVNFNKLYSVYQYADHSTRSGESALEKPSNPNSKDDAYDYATEWSYKPIESLTLLIPNFMGGSSSENMGEKSSWYGNPKLPESLQTSPPTYWGQMPFTGGPVYIGAVLFSLFCFGFLFLKNRWKWWVIIASGLLILLAWGKFSPVYDIFYNAVPLFDKFRTPMMALLMLSLLLPIVALKGVDTALNTKKQKITLTKILIGFGVPAGIILLFGLLGSSLYSFEGAIDAQLKDSGFTNNLINGLIDDRKTLLFNDSLRSLLFVSLTGFAFWLFMKNYIKPSIIIASIILLGFLDLFLINQRYLSQDNFENKASYANTLRSSSVNREIQKDNSLHFRVYEAIGNPFANASTSYHHNSLGGYHAAKLQSYDDLITNNISRNDIGVLNMLNTKYFIGQGQDGSIGYQENETAFGNGWFAETIVQAKDDASALKMLSEVDLKNEAIVQGTVDKINSSPSDSLQLGTIQLTSYHPEKMIYKSSSNEDGFGVFSEIFYQQKDGDGWIATIDGEPAEVFKTNFILRGLNIPAGEHEIVFKYQKKAFQKRALVSKIFSGLLLLLGIGFLWNLFSHRRLKSHV